MGSSFVEILKLLIDKGFPSYFLFITLNPKIVIDCFKFAEVGGLEAERKQKMFRIREKVDRSCINERIF